MAARPSHHANSSRSSFRNPWDSAQPPTWSELIWNGIPLDWAREHLHKHPKARDINVIKPDWGTGEGKGDGKDIKATWLGHASVLIELPWAGQKDRTVKLLFDPMFSSKAGPTAYTGPGRLKNPPCQLSDLPGCDCIFISHNHYDHLDYSSIMSLKKLYPDAHYFVPLANKSWFVGCGIDESKIAEMDWWEDLDLFCDDLGLVSTSCAGPEPDSKLRVTCVPAQHNSGRGARDQKATLWSGWVLEQILSSKLNDGDNPSTQRVTRRGSIYFAGDTGYRRYASSKEVCPAFEEIGKKFGPFDISLIPIWRGGTLGFISWAGLRVDEDRFPSQFHGSPKDAVCIHKDVKSRNSIGMHFGTFIGAEAESFEAVIALQEACDDNELRRLDDPVEGPNGRMGVIDIGETYIVRIEDLAIF